MSGQRSAPRDRQPLLVIPGWGGWTEVRWRLGQPNELVAYARFELGKKTQALRAAELRVTGESVRSHRDLPLSRVENAVNADASLRYDLTLDMDKDPGADIPRFFSMKKAIKRGMTPPVRLERPASRRLDDDFYKQVAAAYTDAVAAGLNPRKTLATDSATPADTVARWVRIARKRGYLPEAQPGKVSA